MAFSQRILAFALLIIVCACSPVSLPLHESPALLESRTLSDGVALRILPLGDSITWGHGSKDGNGYRLQLLNQLPGNSVTYIGSQRSGSMANNNHEGRSGAVIADIDGFAQLSLSQRPNVVLILAGTNDANNLVDLAGAPERLGSLIDHVVGVCPDAAVIVAQMPPIADAEKDAAAKGLNAAIPGIVGARKSAGAHVLTVDMSSALSVENLKDGLHPNDIGYRLMAEAWYRGIQQAADNGWIAEPIKLPHRRHKPCKTFLEWDGSFGEIATGVGSGDGPFVPAWQSAGQLATGNVGFNDNFVQSYGVRIADLDGDGRDDYLWVHPHTGAVTLYLNGGYTEGEGINWIAKGQIATGLGPSAGVKFADINGDGLDDYLWISDDGIVTAYINGGEQPEAEGGWAWSSLGEIAGHGTGGTKSSTIFADIDGDGRADYVLVGEDGSLNAWLNLAGKDVPTWLPLGIIATGIGIGQAPFHVRLYDLNNDGRADYIWIGDDGAVTAYINTRAGSKGLVPTWVDAGEIATGVGAPYYLVLFGDLNGDGKADYLRTYSKTGALDVWFNTGSGGAYVTGDVTVFADMDGDGYDDYIAIGVGGAIDLWRNAGYNSSAKKWNWEPQGRIATGVAARENIRISDLDGDGLADYLVVHDATGAVDFWQNGGRLEDGSWSWTNKGQVATGVGAGAGVRFADVDGDGLVDYLWVADNGAVDVYLNGGPGGDGDGDGGWVWKPQGRIATGVGGARDDIHFHDLDGDGLSDYLWVNRLDGSVSEWTNGGVDGASWRWTPKGQIATGVGANGLSVHFADIHGSGRGDYLVVAPESGSVTEWRNECYGEDWSGTAWMSAQCSNPGVTDAGLNPKDRWNAIDTNSAWTAAIAGWQSNNLPGSLSFTRWTSQFFKGKENMDCGVIAPHNGCDDTHQCDEVNHPAGYFILNSMTQLNRMNLNLYEGLNSARSTMATNIAEFTATFNPIKDTSLTEKIILDLAGFGFISIIAPFWNSAMKENDYFKKNPNKLASVKDIVNSLVTTAFTVTKDTIVGDASLGPRDTLESSMGSLVSYWQEAIRVTNLQLFDGSTGSINQLSQIIADGQVMSNVSTSDQATQVFIQKAIYVSLIPEAWGVSQEGYHPFILDSGAPCDGPANPPGSHISDEVAETNSVCYKDHLYFFVSAPGTFQSCAHPGGVTPDCVRFAALPGVEALDGEKFGTITPSDLVEGALASYHANGNKNGWPQADLAQKSTIDGLSENGIHSPGFVMIPICSAETALANLGNVDAPGYPCHKG